MRPPIRSENTPQNHPVPWWLRGRQLRISFPDPGEAPPDPEPPARPVGVVVPPDLQEVYADLFGVPALLDSLPDPKGDPTPDASDRAAVHPGAANEREGRNHG